MENNLTQTSTITSKYQTVVPSLIRKNMNIKKNQKLIWQVIDMDKRPIVLVSLQKKDWSGYMSGLGKEVWEGVNTASYLSNLKKEWKR